MPGAVGNITVVTGVDNSALSRGFDEAVGITKNAATRLEGSAFAGAAPSRGVVDRVMFGSQGDSMLDKGGFLGKRGFAAMGGAEGLGQLLAGNMQSGLLDIGSALLKTTGPYGMLAGLALDVAKPFLPDFFEKGSPKSWALPAGNEWGSAAAAESLARATVGETPGGFMHEWKESIRELFGLNGQIPVVKKSI